MTHPTDIGRPVRVLDLYCCQGGAGMGYYRAGMDVTGVDITAQPRYPLGFHQADALEFLAKFGRAFDFIHASPPCQFYSDTQRLMGNQHPDLIASTRAALLATGRPYVIENVRGAVPHLHNPVMLCGATFGLETYRHRYFETSGWTLTPPAHPAHTAPVAKMGRPIPPGHYGQFVGNFSGVGHARRVMGVPWMNRDGIRECIPPAYTEWIGRTFLTSLIRPAEAAA